MIRLFAFLLISAQAVLSSKGFNVPLSGRRADAFGTRGKRWITSSALVRGGYAGSNEHVLDGTTTAPSYCRGSGDGGSSSHSAYEEVLQSIKLDFPIFRSDIFTRDVGGQYKEGVKAVFLDSGASSQQPDAVLDSMNVYHTTSHANVHTNSHVLGARATVQFEHARDIVQHSINAARREEVVFTRGATDAVNIVALGLTSKIKAGDEILVSIMEHHANLVPWQLLAQRTGAVIKYINLTADGSALDMDHFYSLLNENTKIVAVAHVSNVLGCWNPVEHIIRAAHKVGAMVLLDSCQAVPHAKIDVQALDADFIVSSGHKMCAPTGIGFLYGKYQLLEWLPASVGGGHMIDKVTVDGSSFASPPLKFEAGTPPIAAAIAMGAAFEYLNNKVGMRNIEEHGIDLGRYMYNELKSKCGDDLVLYGPSPEQSDRVSLVAFNCKYIHPQDLAVMLSADHGVYVRGGSHCAQPLHTALHAKFPLDFTKRKNGGAIERQQQQSVAVGSVRASPYFYNDKADVDRLVSALQTILAQNRPPLPPNRP